MPQLVLAVVADEEKNIPDAIEAERRARGPAWRVVRIAFFAKRHHLDDAGTVDAFPLGQLDARLIELGSAEYVRDQVREALAAATELVGHALTDQGFHTPPERVHGLFVEIDLQAELARQLSDEQPCVSDVTPPERTVGSRIEAPRRGRGA